MDEVILSNHYRYISFWLYQSHNEILFQTHSKLGQNRLSTEKNIFNCTCQRKPDEICMKSHYLIFLIPAILCLASYLSNCQFVMVAYGPSSPSVWFSLTFPVNSFSHLISWKFDAWKWYGHVCQLGDLRGWNKHGTVTGRFQIIQLSVKLYKL